MTARAARCTIARTMVLVRPIAAALLAALAAGCGGEASLPDELTWRKALLDERAGTDAEFRAPASSPLSAIDRHALRSGEATYVHVDASEVRLDDKGGGSAALSFQPAGASRWSWEAAASGVAATLLDGDRPLAPGPVAALSVFRLGRFSVVAQPVPDSLVLMLHDSQREELRHFSGLDYFAPDQAYLVTARIRAVDRTAAGDPADHPSPREVVSPARAAPVHDRRPAVRAHRARASRRPARRPVRPVPRRDLRKVRPTPAVATSI